MDSRSCGEGAAVTRPRAVGGDRCGRGLGALSRPIQTEVCTAVFGAGASPELRGWTKVVGLVAVSFCGGGDVYCWVLVGVRSMCGTHTRCKGVQPVALTCSPVKVLGGVRRSHRPLCALHL